MRAMAFCALVLLISMFFDFGNGFGFFQRELCAPNIFSINSYVILVQEFDFMIIYIWVLGLGAHEYFKVNELAAFDFEVQWR